MEPIYKGFQDIVEFYSKYGIDSHTNPSEEEMKAREALALSHNHGCWLNPCGTLASRRTKRLCKKFCKKNGIPKETYNNKYYDCDMCPNCITYYKDGDNFLFALGNSYLYHKQGLMEKF